MIQINRDWLIKALDMKLKHYVILTLLISAAVASESNEDEWKFDESPLAEDEMDGVYDPLEPYNRLMFKINGAIDKVFLIPISMTYKHIFPRFLQIGIANFASNFFTPIDIINYTLQGNPENIVKSTFRMIINTFLGFFGTVDVADKMGLKKKTTSLGETFKKWGMKPGPYLVLPLLGSGSFRTGIGNILQMPVDPVAQVSLKHWKKNTRRRIYYCIYGANVVVKRANLLDIMFEIEETSDDVYKTTRNAIMSLEN